MELGPKAAAAANAWGCTVESLRRAPPAASDALESPVEHLPDQGLVSREECFRYFWSAYRNTMPTDLADLQQLSPAWMTKLAALLPPLVLLKYGPVRDLPGSQSLDANVNFICRAVDRPCRFIAACKSMKAEPTPRAAWEALRATAKASEGIDLENWVLHYGKGVSRSLGYLVALRQFKVVLPVEMRDKWPHKAKTLLLGRAAGGKGKLYALCKWSSEAESVITAYMDMDRTLQDGILTRMPRTFLDYEACARSLTKHAPGLDGYVARWTARSLIVTAMALSQITLSATGAGTAWPAHVEAEKPSRLSKMFPDQMEHLSHYASLQQCLELTGYDGKLELLTMWLCLLMDEDLIPYLRHAHVGGAPAVVAVSRHGKTWTATQFAGLVARTEQSLGMMPCPLRLLQHSLSDEPMDSIQSSGLAASSHKSRDSKMQKCAENKAG